MDDVIQEYLKLCVEYDNSATNSKYCVQMMLRELQETPRGKKFLECQTLEDIWYVLNEISLVIFERCSYKFSITIAVTYGTWELIAVKNN